MREERKVAVLKGEETSMVKEKRRVGDRIKGEFGHVERRKRR